MIDKPDIITFIRDSSLINSDVSSWQETSLRLFYGLPLDEEQQAIAKQALGTDDLPNKAFREGTWICGRRSGKSNQIAANIAVYEAAFGGHEEFLSPGERAHIMLISQDMRAGRVSYRYILGKLEGSPLLSQLIEDVRKEEIDLSNRLTISIFPCSYRAPRGFAIPIVVLDELAFFRVEGVNVDREVVDSVRAAMAQFPHSKMVKTSSPYSKAGELYKDFSERHSRPDLLCFHAATWQMNPSIDQEFLDSEKVRDPEFFDREYAAIFTDAISSAFTREAVEACVIQGRHELPLREGFIYTAAVDPAGGGADEFTLAVCHQEEGKVVQDCLRAFRSKRPADVVKEMATTLESYGISYVTGDRYSGEWVRQAFRESKIEYYVAELTSSDAFLEVLPAINQAKVELLDDKIQTAQLIALERRRGRTGKDTLGHPPGGHDDRANALALAVSLFPNIWDNRPRTLGEITGVFL